MPQGLLNSKPWRPSLLSSAGCIVGRLPKSGAKMSYLNGLGEGIGHISDSWKKVRGDRGVCRRRPAGHCRGQNVAGISATTLGSASLDRSGGWAGWASWLDGVARKPWSGRSSSCSRACLAAPSHRWQWVPRVRAVRRCHSTSTSGGSRASSTVRRSVASSSCRVSGVRPQRHRQIFGLSLIPSRRSVLATPRQPRFFFSRRDVIFSVRPTLAEEALLRNERLVQQALKSAGECGCKRVPGRPLSGTFGPNGSPKNKGIDP